MYEGNTKDFARSWTQFQKKSWHLCLLFWCLPGFITSPLYKLYLRQQLFKSRMMWLHPGNYSRGRLHSIRYPPHRRPTLRESEELIIYLFMYSVSVTAVRVGTWPFILRGVWLHENRWDFERFIRRCMGNKISLIYNAKCFEIFTFFK